MKRKTEEQSFWKKLTVDFLCYNSCVWQPIATGGTYIESVDSLKLLVFTLPKIILSWAVHCDYVIKKANRRLYTLRNLRKVECIRMILLLSTVHLSDLYLNMQPLLLLISPIISPVTWRKSKSAPSPLSIPLLHMKINHSDFISIM